MNLEQIPPLNVSSSAEWAGGLAQSQNEASVALIIVTHNSEKYIDKCMACIAKQTHHPRQIILVDSGSANCDYLSSFNSNPSVQIVLAGKDVGFCLGNNIGLGKVLPETEFVFFLNPDAFLTPEYIAKAVEFMGDPNYHHCGALTGTTESYCMDADRPKELYDTTGVFSTWWGRWYDRGQQEPVNPRLYREIELIPAICGAVFFCRHSAIKTVMLSENQLFDNRFYMYKEDIDLSLRLRKKGWELLFVPELLAYHCRGWNRNRRSMPKKMRLHSAQNELRIHWRQKSLIPFFYSAMKYCAVKCFNC